MIKTYVIDVAGGNREMIISQLRALGVKEITPFTTVHQAWKAIDVSNSAPDIILVSSAVEMRLLSDFLTLLRPQHKNVAVISYATSISLEQMRTLVQNGVDQILLHPYNSLVMEEKIKSAREFRVKVNAESTQIPKNHNFTHHLESYAQNLFKIVLEGWLAEHAVLPEIKFALPNSFLFIDFDQLHGMNSVGLRTWVIWLKALQEKGVTQFEFQNLRSVILRQAATVKGFLPEGSTISSFYLTYFNEERNEEREFHFNREKNFLSGSFVVPEKVEFTENGNKIQYVLGESMAKLNAAFNGAIIVA